MILEYFECVSTAAGIEHISPLRMLLKLPMARIELGALEIVERGLGKK